MKYADIQQNTTRLVVLYSHDNEQFQWGMIGSFPVMTLLGYITEVQNELIDWDLKSVRWMCPESALVIVLDSDGTLYRFVNEHIPTYPLVGMLETVKVELIASYRLQQKVQQAQSSNTVQILDRNGKHVQ